MKKLALAALTLIPFTAQAVQCTDVALITIVPLAATATLTTLLNSTVNLCPASYHLAGGLLSGATATACTILGTYKIASSHYGPSSIEINPQAIPFLGIFTGMGNIAGSINLFTDNTPVSIRVGSATVGALVIVGSLAKACIQ